MRAHSNQEKLYHRLPAETIEPAPLIESCVEPASIELGKDFCEELDPEPEPEPGPDPDQGYRMDSDSMAESMETESLSIDSEEDEQVRSPYDRPHTLQVDLGDGDLATGYTDR